MTATHTAELSLRALTGPAAHVTLSHRLARHLTDGGHARQQAAEARREISG
jgi:hypothetical protein